MLREGGKLKYTPRVGQELLKLSLNIYLCLTSVQDIDGQALLLLTLPTVQECMDLKLGPAIKLCHQIERVKVAFYRQYANWLRSCNSKSPAAQLASWGKCWIKSVLVKPFGMFWQCGFSSGVALARHKRKLQQKKVKDSFLW